MKADKVRVLPLGLRLERPRRLRTLPVPPPEEDVPHVLQGPLRRASERCWEGLDVILRARVLLEREELEFPLLFR